MSKSEVHVVPNGDQWAVKRAGAQRASSLHSTQSAAIDAGRPLARRDKVEFLVHGVDGRIRLRDSYGNDSFPPAG